MNPIHCALPGCHAATLATLPMCRDHWFDVPPTLRARWYAINAGTSRTSDSVASIVTQAVEAAAQHLRWRINFPS